jgi:NADPH:quinone reductase-like Zn-dependent oxidoreductase
MKASVITANGPPSVLRYEEAPDPQPGPRDILVRVEAISIEGGDLINRQSVPPPAKPHVVGYQAAGEVIAAGPEAARFKVGQRVATFHWHGSHAALRAVPEDHAWAVPDGLDIKLASTIPVTFGTADDALFDVGRLQAGETVLIQGGAGGVGLAAIQLAHAAGATVIATAAGAERAQALLPFGCDHGLDYRAGDIAESVKRLTGGKGADLVLDMAAGAGFGQLIRAMAYRGRLVTVGFVDGQASVSLMDLLRNGLSVHGILFGREMAGPRARALIERHLQDAASAKARMPVARVFPLSEAAAAHEYVASGHPFGRVILTP